MIHAVSYINNYKYCHFHLNMRYFLITCFASHKSNPLSVPQGIVDSYSTLPWVMWEAVTVAEDIP